MADNVGTPKRMNPSRIAPIETGVSIPPRGITTSFGERISMFNTLRALKVGQSFVIDKHEWRSRVTASANNLNIPVQTHRLADGKLRVMRVEEKKPRKGRKP